MPETFEYLCDWGRDLDEAMVYNKVIRGSGTSMRNLRHHYQNFKKKDFFKYDPKFKLEEIPIKKEDVDLPSWWRFIKAEVKSAYKKTKVVVKKALTKVKQQTKRFGHWVKR